MATTMVANPGKHGLTRSELEREIDVIVASDQPIVVGPWFAEVGFEVLYWIPFLRWVVERMSLSADRLIAVSRGGVGTWYADLSRRYVDVLDLLSPEDLQAGAKAHRRASHTQKQLSLGELDARVLELVRERMELGSVEVLHPSLMYRSFRAFWMGKEPFRSALDRLRFRRFPTPRHAATEHSIPNGTVTAAKFYYRQSFPESAANERLARALVAAAARSTVVVLLDTGIRLDDHREAEVGQGNGVVTLSGTCAANENLAAQSVALSRSNLFIGTYGGAAYLASVYGVPGLAVWSDPAKVNPVHVEVGRVAGEALGAPLAAVATDDLDLLGLLEATSDRVAGGMSGSPNDG